MPSRNCEILQTFQSQEKDQNILVTAQNVSATVLNQDPTQEELTWIQTNNKDSTKRWTMPQTMISGGSRNKKDKQFDLQNLSLLIKKKHPNLEITAIKPTHELASEGSFSINLEKCMQKYNIESQNYTSNFESSAKQPEKRGI